MTFETTEESVESGSPVDFYEFNVAGTFFRFVGADTDLVKPPDTYTAAAIGRSPIKQSGPNVENEVEIQIGLADPNINTFAREWATRAPEGRTSVQIFTRHLQDGTAEFKTIFLGSVVSARYDAAGLNAPVRARLQCKAIGDILAREGPRNTWGRTCEWQFGDSRCTVNLTTVTDRLPVTSISASLLDVTATGLSAQPDGNYVGGYATRVTKPFDFRWIMDHTGDVVTLNQPFNGLAIGEEVDFVQGCRHTVADCRDRYNNIENHGGIPYTPRLNPFDHSLDSL